MEQREPNTNAPERVHVPAECSLALHPVDVSSRIVASSAGDTHTPHSCTCRVPPPPSGAEKPNYLSKTSALYIICAGHLFLAVLYLAFYEQGRISRAYYDDLKVNLRPPWILYRWLGSKGVDVTDLQWYYFIIALPPAAPYLIMFLLISRWLRRYISSQPATAVSWTSSVTNSANDFSLNDRKATVKGNAEFKFLHFGSNNSNDSPSTPNGAVKEKESSNACLAAVVVRDSPHWRSNVPLVSSSSSSSPSGALLVRRNISPLHIFHVFSGALIAFCLSGPGILFGIILMSLNFFCIAPLYKKFSFRVCMTVMWVTHIAVLFLNFHAGGYKFAWFGLSFLDNLWSPLIRWNVQYNMTILRMISFNSDLWESALYGEERRQKSLQKHERSCIACAEIRDQNKHDTAMLPREAVSCYKCRTECCRAVPEFTFVAYMGYIFYLPLFMAGPLSSFNAYVSYMHYPQRSVTGRATWRYGLRWLGHALMLSTLMHYVHIMAMCFTPTAPKATADAATTTVRVVEAAKGFSITSTTLAPGPPVMQLMSLPKRSVLFFLVLTFLWAKFDVIWRFFRFFALLDGLDPPEDMPRCFANTVNIQSFWRDWHASFNLWIVRYMYIPMGGSRTKFFSIFPIFFFIAIWHDIELRLLYWAFFICVGFTPEIVVTTFFSSKTNKIVLYIKRHRLLWRSLRVLGAQLCLMELAIANLIGFAIGAPNTKASLRQLFNELSATFLLFFPFCFFCAANLAIQDRDQKMYEAAQKKLKYNLK